VESEPKHLLPHSVLFWGVFSYLAIRHGFMARTACVVLGTIVDGIPLAVLLWWQPKMMRQIVEKRLQWKGEGNLCLMVRFWVSRFSPLPC
jgi:hypothetical protein